MAVTRHLTIAALLLAAGGSLAADLRLVNGVTVKGDVGQVSESGIDVQTAQGPVKYAWKMLSPGTRYRYDGKYRTNYQAVLQGLPTSARTNAPDSEYKP